MDKEKSKKKKRTKDEDFFSRARKICELDENRVKELFSQIDSEDRPGAETILLRYIKLDSGENREFYPENFLERYVESYKLKKPFQRTFHDGLEKIIGIVSTKEAIHRAMTSWNNIFRVLPPYARSEWIESLNHVYLEKKEGPKKAESQLRRYMDASYFSLIPFVHSFLSVFELLKQGESLKRAEGFLFDLVREQNLGSTEAQACFKKLQRVPIVAREYIETIRQMYLSDKTSLNKTLFELITHPTQTEESCFSTAFLLWKSTILSTKPSSEYLQENAVLLNKVATKNRALFHLMFEPALKITGWDERLLRPYLEITEQIADLERASINEKLSYINFVSEIFEDYFSPNFRKDKNNINIKETCLDAIYRFEKLVPENRKTAINLTKAFSKILRVNRLMPSNEHYFHYAMKTIADAVAYDAEKASAFINPIIGIRKQE